MGLIGAVENWFELSSFIHQHCSPKTEYFAKVWEKCNLLSHYLCKDLKNLDDLEESSCPKASNLLHNLDTDWNCSNYPHQTEKTFH